MNWNYVSIMNIKRQLLLFHHHPFGIATNLQIFLQFSNNSTHKKGNIVEKTPTKPQKQLKMSDRFVLFKQIS